MVTVNPGRPISCLMVNKSKRLGGCSPTPSPALIIGLRAALAAMAAEPFRVSEHNHISVGFERADGIRQGLTLGDREYLTSLIGITLPPAVP